MANNNYGVEAYVAPTKDQLRFTSGHKNEAVDLIECWACKERMTLAERASNDGFCPFCGSEIELEN